MRTELRCSLCGNDNPEHNRFCGMCGASLLLKKGQSPVRVEEAPKPVVPEIPQPPLAKAEPMPAVEPARQQDPPSIAGPSFLGLNQPASPPAKRGTSLAHGSHLERSGGSLDYLLDDEEEPRSSGAGKIFLILIALALVVGFGYLRFRHEGLSALMSGMKKPTAAATQPAADSGQTSASSTPSPAPEGASAPSGTPGSASSIEPVPDVPAQTGNPTPANPVTNTEAAGSAPAATSSGPTPSGTIESSAATPKEAPPKNASKPSDAADPNKVPAGAPVPKRDPRVRTAPPTRVRPPDPVLEAENYIYGRGGAQQDCDRGLRMLRPVADQANPRAMISLGALYSTGVCAPRDLPTAYRWFALALRKQPENEPLQENLQRLWGQMTAAERQLAIKLTQ